LNLSFPQYLVFFVKHSLCLATIYSRFLILVLVVIVDAGCEDRTFAVRMRGHTVRAVVEELGQPQTTISFPANPSLYEYQMGLRHHLSRAELAAHVVVKEGCWPALLSTRYVWFAQREEELVAVDALDSPRGRQY